MLDYSAEARLAAVPTWFRVAAVVIALSLAAVGAGTLADISYHLSKSRHEAGESDRRASESDGGEQHAQAVPTLYGLIMGGYERQYAAYCKQRSTPNAEDWTRDYWCGAKFTDVASTAAAFATAFLTFGLLIIAAAQWFVYLMQAKIMRYQTVVSQRPWISVGIAGASDLMVMPDQEWYLHINLAFKNHGNSPALNVKYNVALIRGDEKEIPQAQDEMRRHIESIFFKAVPSSGFTIFSSDTVGRVDQLQKWSFRPQNKLGFKPRKENYAADKFIIGYVSYSFATGEKGQTWFAYMVAKKSGGHTIIVGVGMAIEANNVRIPSDDLIFHATRLGESCSMKATAPQRLGRRTGPTSPLTHITSSDVVRPAEIRHFPLVAPAT